MGQAVVAPLQKLLILGRPVAGDEAQDRALLLVTGHGSGIGIGARPVFPEPHKDLRDPHGSVGPVDLQPHAAGQPALALILQLLVELCTRERFATQRRTAHGGADEGGVDAGLVVLAAQNLVLDPVKGELLPHQRVAVELPHAGDVLDAGPDRIVLNDRAQGEGVVGVDQQGDLIGLRPGGEALRRQRGQVLEVAIQLGRIALQGVVVHQPLLVDHRLQHSVEWGWIQAGLGGGGCCAAAALAEDLRGRPATAAGRAEQQDAAEGKRRGSESERSHGGEGADLGFTAEAAVRFALVCLPASSAADPAAAATTAAAVPGS